MVVVVCLLVQEAAAQKGGAKAGMRRGGRGGGRTGGRGGGGTRGEEAGAGEWGGRQQGGLDRDRKRPCVGICYLRWGEGDITRGGSDKCLYMQENPGSETSEDA